MSDYKDELSKYANCMEEIKLRTFSIKLIMEKEKTTGFLYTDIEFICLQFRKILELISLANLSANKEQYAKQYIKFKTHWNAKKILEDIKKINPNFYPKPTEQIIDQKTGKVKEIKDIKKGYLTKEDFISVYDICSSMLHARNPFDEQLDLKKIYSQFEHRLILIKTLLSHHNIQLINIDKQIRVLMNAKEDNKVHTYLFQKQ